MFKNYIKIAFRNLKRNKPFSFINIVGLAIGISCFILIALYVFDELGYDRYIPNADRIYRVNSDIKFGGAESKSAFSSDMMGPALKKDFPEVENFTCVYNARGSKLIKRGDQFIEEVNVAHADSNFFSVFTLPAIAGDAKIALDAPNSVVITESTARKYFGAANALGKLIETNDFGKTIYKVTAVIADFPAASHINFDFLFSMKNANYTWGHYLAHNFHTYLLFAPGTNIKDFEKKRFSEYLNKYVLPEAQEMINITSLESMAASGTKLEYSLIPVKDIHLYSNRTGEFRPGGNIEYIYIFSIAVVFILIIACINFMNLTTARSASRAKEVGIRKVLGTERKSLVLQFLSESVAMALFSVVLAVIITLLALPLFNSVSGKNIMMQQLTQPFFLLLLLSLPLVIGVIAGSYPAFFLSSFQPIEVLKGKLKLTGRNSGIRGGLVVFQFTTSIILIVGTVTIYEQLHYIQNKNLGYNKSQVLLIENAYSLGDKLERFKQEMLQNPGVSSATISSFLPTPSSRSSHIFSKTQLIDTRNGFSMQEWSIDYDYLHTLGMELKAGRNFSRDFGTDSAAVIINETTAGYLGKQDVVGEYLYREEGEGQVKAYKIIGVVKDFHYESMKANIDLVGLFLRRSSGNVVLKVQADRSRDIVQQAEQRWKALAPQMPFHYNFMDSQFNQVYQSEQKIGKIAVSFSVLAILIACLGLLGLSAFIAEQRTKEIGIRKVLGAGAASIVAMLSRDFLKLVVIAAFIAFPIAWWAMRTWLNDFAYRINISWSVFVIAGLAAVFIALVTISFQAFRAALANPVKSLRAE